MVRVETSAVINRPVEEVFAFVDNPENNLQWTSGTLEAEYTSEGPVEVGTTGRDVGILLGRRIETTWEITEYEPNKKRGFKTTSGPLSYEATQIFGSVEGGTSVNITAQGETGGFFKLAEPIVARMLQRLVDGNLANLKDLLEAQAEDSA